MGGVAPYKNGNLVYYLGFSLIRNTHLVNIHLKGFQMRVLGHR